MKLSIARPLASLFGTALTGLLLGGSAALTHGLASSVDHGAPIISFEAHDYEFTGPTTLQTGFVNLELSNHGDELHHLQVVRLLDGVTVDAFYAALQEGEAAAMAKIELVGGVGALLPGQSQTVMVELVQAGTYFLLCFIQNAEGVPHLALGMASPIEVVEAETVTEAPEVDLTVALIDFEFDIPDQVTAGLQTWEVMNDGPEAHELNLMTLLPGKTIADVEAFLQNGEGEMPMTFAGGVQALSVGKRNFITMDLQPGTYVALCFVPSPAMGGAPHMALGMVKPFTVVDTTAQR